jgi:hypothetical protein
MSNAINPAAPHFLPFFITPPGETDVLFTGVVVFLVVALMTLGVMYFWLHSIPERIAHGASKTQFQLVAVMSLLALFTHNNAFWVGALLLALIPIPDFWTPLAMMADSLAKMAGRRLRHAPEDESPVSAAEHSAIASSSPYATAPSDGGVAAPAPVVTIVAPTAPANAAPAPIAEASGSSRQRALSKEGA